MGRPSYDNLSIAVNHRGACVWDQGRSYVTTRIDASEVSRCDLLCFEGSLGWTIDDLTFAGEPRAMDRTVERLFVVVPGDYAFKMANGLSEIPNRR